MFVWPALVSPTSNTVLPLGRLLSRNLPAASSSYIRLAAHLYQYQYRPFPGVSFDGHILLISTNFRIPKRDLAQYQNA